VAALGSRHREQFEKGACAHQDLPAERIGGGQQALGIQAQRDLALTTKVGQPRLQVVRVGCQKRIREHPAPEIQLA
jgi:hypothetical protein